MKTIKLILCLILFLIITAPGCWAIEPYRVITLPNQDDDYIYDNISYSDSGQYIIATRTNGGMNVWNADDGRLIKSIGGRESSSIGISTNRFADEVIAYYPNQIKVIDMKSTKRNEKFFSFDKEITSADINNAGTLLAVGFKDGSAGIYSAISGMLKDSIFAEYKSPIKTMQYSLSSQLLLICYENGEVYISTEDGKNILLSKKYKTSLKDVSLSKNSAYIISIHTNNVIRVRSIYDFSLIATRSFNKNLKKVYTNYFNKLFYLVTEENEIISVEFTEDGNFITSFLSLSSIDVSIIAMSPLKTNAGIIRSSGKMAETYNFDTRRYNKLSNHAVIESIITIEGGTEAFAVLSNNILVRIYLLRDNLGKALSKIPLGEKQSVNEKYYLIADEVNKILIVVGSSGRKIIVYKYKKSIIDGSLTELQHFQIKGEITSIDFISEKKLILFGTKEGYIIGHNIETSEEILNIPSHNGRVNSLVHTKDGRFLFSAGEDGFIGKVLLEDNYDEIIRMENHEQALSLELYEPEDADPYLISGGSEGKISLWNYSEGLTLSPPSFDAIKSNILTITHIDPQKVIKILKPSDEYIIDRPDGHKTKESNQFVLVSTDEGIDYLIRIPDIKIMHVFKPSKSPIHNTTLTKDGNYLMSLGDDGTLRMYDTSYILGYGYSSSGFYEYSATFLNKALDLHSDTDNNESIIRDRRKQAEVLAKLGKPEEAINILERMNAYLEVNPIETDPFIEDGTLDERVYEDDTESHKEPTREEILDSQVLDEYKYIAIKPQISDYEYISQQRLAYADFPTEVKIKNIIDNYLQLGDLYLEYFFKYSEAKAYYKKAIDLGMAHKINSYTAKAYYRFAMAVQKHIQVVRRLGGDDYDIEIKRNEAMAEFNIHTGIEKGREIDDLNTIALGYETYGDLYLLRSEFGLSKENYLKAKNIYENFDEQLSHIRVLKKLAGLHISSSDMIFELDNRLLRYGDFLEIFDIGNAMNYLNEAVRLAEDLSLYKVIGELHNYQSKMYLVFGDFKNALLYARKAVKAFDIHGSTENMMNNYLIQSQIFLKVGDNMESLKALDEVEKLIIKSGVPSLIYAIDNRRAYVHYKNGMSANEATEMLEDNLDKISTSTPQEKALKAEAYYLMYLINKDNPLEERHITLGYLRAAIAISLDVYTNEYFEYQKKAEEEGILEDDSSDTSD